MELLEFARGPALAVSVAIFLGGLAWRLARIFRRPVRPDFSLPRKSAAWTGGVRAIFAKTLPAKGVRIRGAQMVNAYAYHVGLAVVAFAFAPHVAFISRHFAVGWTPLPDAVTYVAAGVAIVGLIVALLYRVSDGVTRLLSTFDDYFSWFVTLLPLLTGMALLPAPAGPGRVAVHLLSLELLLVWLPFGKLAHAALVFVSRWRSGVDFARKGAAL